MPKGIVSLKIYTGDCEFGRTAHGRVFVEVWNQVLQEYLREFYYMAQMASLHASMSIPVDNYNIQWGGFSDSLPTFVEETLKRIKGFNAAEHEPLFNQVKEKLMQQWYNFYLEQAYMQGVAQFENIIITTAFEKKELRTLLTEMTFEQFTKQAKKWLQSARFVWFVHGNISKEQALGLVETARNTILPKSIAKEDLVDVRCIALPAGKTFLLEKTLEDPTNENNCLISYFEVGPEDTDLKTKLIHAVAMQYLDEPFFNQLRTIE